MKILMINHFPLAGSGSGTYTRNLAVQLAAAGHEVTVVLPENTSDYERVEGVRLHPVFFTPETGGSESSKTGNSDCSKAGNPDCSKTGGSDCSKAGGSDNSKTSTAECSKAGGSDNSKTSTAECSKTGVASTGETMEDALPFNFPCFTTHPRSIVSFGDLSDEELAMYMDAFRSAIRDEIDNNRPDIIHGQHVWILPDLATGFGIPIVLTAHGTDLMGYDKWPEMRKYADHVIKESSRVISISQDNLELLNSMFPDQKEKFVRKRNGYDPGVFYTDDLDREEVLSGFGITHDDLVEEPSEDGTKADEITRKLVCFAGKLTRFKGVDVLLDAVKIISDRKASAEGAGEKALLMEQEGKSSAEGAGVVPSKDRVLPEFLIVGDGEERDALKKKKEDLGLSNVKFLGNVDQSTLRAIYNVSDLDVVPSRREPFGLVAIEAMACGIPVVASDQGGLPDFVNESVGALFIPEDAADLAEKILEVLGRVDKEAFDAADGGSGDSWRTRISKYARENYAQDKIIHELEELYNEVLAMSD